MFQQEGILNENQLDNYQGKMYYSQTSSKVDLFSEDSLNNEILKIFNSLWNKDETTSKGEESFSASKIDGKRFFSKEENKWAQENAVIEQQKYHKLIEKLSTELEDCLNIFQYESRLYSKTEEMVIDIEHNYSLRILGDVIQTVYIRNYNKPNYLIGICNALLRYDLEEVKPWAIVLLSGLINHPNETVKEYVVQLIDNWNDKALLPILGTIEIVSEWLKDYVNEVVKNIGGI